MDGQSEELVISAEDKARFAKASRQLASYTNFLRWSANFAQYELLCHPQHQSIMMLSPMQSARFSYDLTEDTLLLGVQPFEMAWLSTLPVTTVHVTDRIYLRVTGVSVMSLKLPPLIIGIYVSDRRKLAAMAERKFLQPMAVDVKDGRVVSVGGAIGTGIPIQTDDIIKTLIKEREADRLATDYKRFI